MYNSNSTTTKHVMKGGHKDYDWSHVRQMSYKERESYLGYTASIGYLDKGSKWKKSDWWTKLKKEGKFNQNREMKMAQI